VNRVDVLGIDARQPVLLRHSVRAMALAASVGNIQRVDTGSRICLGKNLVRAAMTARAWMVLGIGMDAAGKTRCLVGVASLALHFCHLLGVRILLDVRVAVVTFQTAVHTVAENLAVDRNAMSVRVRHAGITVACQALRLRTQAGRTAQQQDCNPRSQTSRADQPLDHARIPTPLNRTRDPVYFCGFRHPAVFLLLEPE